MVSRRTKRWILGAAIALLVAILAIAAFVSWWERTHFPGIAP